MSLTVRLIKIYGVKYSSYQMENMASAPDLFLSYMQDVGYFILPQFTTLSSYKDLFIYLALP